MKAPVWMGTLLLVLSVAYGAEAQQQTGRDSFLDLVEVGQRVVLADAEGGGYYLAVGENLPVWIGAATGQGSLQQAEAARRLLAEQYQEVLEANRRVPNAVPQQQVERLRLQLAQQTQAVEQARQQTTRPVEWNVSAVGRDYVALRNGNTIMRLPLTSIRAIVEQTAEPKAKSPPSE